MAAKLSLLILCAVLVAVQNRVLEGRVRRSPDDNWNTFCKIYQNSNSKGSSVVDTIKSGVDSAGDKISEVQSRVLDGRVRHSPDDSNEERSWNTFCEVYHNAKSKDSYVVDTIKSGMDSAGDKISVFKEIIKNTDAMK